MVEVLEVVELRGQEKVHCASVDDCSVKSGVNAIDERDQGFVWLDAVAAEV